MLEMLTKLCDCWGPSGCEQQVRDLIINFAKPFSSDISTDPLGNLIIRKGTPGGRRIMLSAHMDEIGLVVTHIDKKGFLRFHTVGGMSPNVIYGQTVRFQNGTVGSVGSEKLEDSKDLKLDKLFIDIGASSEAEAQAMVSIGDMCCYNQNLRQVGNRLVGKALDDRLGCAVLLVVLSQLSSTPHDSFFVFSVQEEVGSRGAQTAAYAIQPQIGLAVDVTGTGDTPDAHILSTALGQGTAIKVMDRSVIAHPKVRHLLTSTAQKHGIRHQADVLPFGGTDAGPIHTSRGGVPSGAVSIPTRYVHTPGEMVDLGDVTASIDILNALLSENFSF